MRLLNQELEPAQLPPCPPLTPAFSNGESDSSSGCNAFNDFVKTHEKRMEALLSAFETECDKQNRRK